MDVFDLQVEGQRTGKRVRAAARWWSRAIGLLATRDLQDPCGLWITPCNSIHTLGMRYPIDVVFVSAGGKIEKIVPKLRPWNLAMCRKARSTLELRAGLAEQLQLHPGMVVALAQP